MDLENAEHIIGLGMKFVDMGHSPVSHGLTSCQGHLKLVLICCQNDSMKWALVIAILQSQFS